MNNWGVEPLYRCGAFLLIYLDVLFASVRADDVGAPTPDRDKEQEFMKTIVHARVCTQAYIYYMVPSHRIEA